MVFETIVVVQDARDSTLSIIAARLPQIVLGDDQHGEPGIDRQRGAKTGQSPADDEDSGEIMGYALGVKWYEIPWGDDGHSDE